MTEDNTQPLDGRCVLAANCRLVLPKSYVPEWCNGSTIDFDSISIGSIPVSGAKQKYTQRQAQADVADYSFGQSEVGRFNSCGVFFCLVSLLTRRVA